MKRLLCWYITSLGLLGLVSLDQQVAVAQEGQADTVRDEQILRRGEPYDVPPLRIRLVDRSTHEPRRRTPVQIHFVTQWVQSADADENSSVAIQAEAVTDDDGFFTTTATTVVPEGLAPPGDDPLFVPRFVRINVGYESPGGYTVATIDPATIDAVRSRQLAYIEIPFIKKVPQHDDSRTEIDVVVQPSADWTNSTVRVNSGDTVTVRATGTISLGRQGSCGPAGIGTVDRDALIADKPLGALIAVVGDGNDDFIFIGAAAEFVSRYDGLLFFSVNEGDLRDNSGTFSVHVRIRRGDAAVSSDTSPGLVALVRRASRDELKLQVPPGSTPN